VANETRREERTVGCFLGGAVGDALGAPVEFLSLDQIRQQFGADGIGDFSVAYGRIGAVTDDTQMTLFTAEGIIRTYQRARDRGQASYLGVLTYAYLRC
jgi:ADP-ribosylglycohydrolase